MSVIFGSDVVESAEYKRKLEERLDRIEAQLGEILSALRVNVDGKALGSALAESVADGSTRL